MPAFGRFGQPSKHLAIAVGTVILLISTWIVFARISAKYSDRDESFYPSLADAGKDGATTRGWIPDDILPSSSRSIHEVHSLSPSREWCVFEFTAEDSETLRMKLKQIDVLPPSIRRIRDPKVSWWPTALKGNLDPQGIRHQGFDLYTIEQPANSVQNFILLFAVDWSKRRAYFYSTYK